ncbi:MAG: hypothetical protein IEMM0008_1026 [bacterium]|nr:MAG: hypothetical protein IEMM0008_1026 [bacterium]
MTKVFADSFYWISLINSKDKWHSKARQISENLSESTLITTDEVLTEVLTYFSAFGTNMRTFVARIIRDILNDPNVEVIPQSHDSFLSGLDLYQQRLDKEYSLTDCVSMQTMRKLKLTDILSHDKHFSQEGFQILL